MVKEPDYEAEKINLNLKKNQNIQLCFYVLWPSLAFFSVGNGVFSLCKTGNSSPLMTSQFRNFPGRSTL